MKDLRFRKTGKRGKSSDLFRWVIVLSMIAVVPFLSIAKRQAHNLEGICDTCHLSFADGKKIFVRDIDVLCKDCHRDLGLSHPSGHVPSMRLPDQFPLDWTGKMTCATCHSIHGESNYLLRGNDTGRKFCYSCHRETFEGHKGISDQPAHAVTGSGKGRGFQILDPANSIDRFSMDCLGCHDSTLGESVSVKVSSKAAPKIGSGIWSHGEGGGGSHPIGVDYMRAYSKSRGGLIHPSRINPAIRLFDGKVGCGSCHSVFSKEKFQLTVRQDARASLCLSCHNK